MCSSRSKPCASYNSNGSHLTTWSLVRCPVNPGERATLKAMWGFTADSLTSEVSTSALVSASNWDSAHTEWLMCAQESMNPENENGNLTQERDLSTFILSTRFSPCMAPSGLSPSLSSFWWFQPTVWNMNIILSWDFPLSSAENLYQDAFGEVFSRQILTV